MKATATKSWVESDYRMSMYQNEIPLLITDKAGRIALLVKYDPKTMNDWEADAIMLVSNSSVDSVLSTGKFVSKLNLEFWKPLEPDKPITLKNK